MKGCRPSSNTPRRFANVWFQMAQTLKRKAATVESQNTNLIARANRSSLDNPGTVVPRENSRFKATAMPGRLEMVDSNPSISAAKVQQNFETTKDKGQKRAMETASVSHDEEHQHAVISFADTAKVQKN